MNEAQQPKRRAVAPLVIRGRYQGGPVEEIDTVTAESFTEYAPSAATLPPPERKRDRANALRSRVRREARRLAAEHRLAYGAGWEIWIGRERAPRKAA